MELGHDLGLGLEDSDLDRPHWPPEVSRELMICLNKMIYLYPYHELNLFAMIYGASCSSCVVRQQMIISFGIKILFRTTFTHPLLPSQGLRSLLSNINHIHSFRCLFCALRLYSILFGRVRKSNRTEDL